MFHLKEVTGDQVVGSFCVKAESSFAFITGPISGCLTSLSDITQEMGASRYQALTHVHCFHPLIPCLSGAL